jgi:AraC-like DNA-binding protein
LEEGRCLHELVRPCSLRNAVSAHGDARFNRLELLPETTKRVRGLFARALDEDTTRESGYRCLLKGIALEMIVLVARDLGFRSGDHRFVASRILDVLEAVEADPTRPVTVGEMSGRAGLSRSQFHAAFKKVTGTTLVGHVTRIRVNVACRHLVGSRLPVVEVCYESGFESVSRFYEAFKRITGMAPGEYRMKRTSEV